MKQVLWTLIVLIVLGLIGALFVIYSGVVNVAATTKPPAIVDWALGTTSDNSVRHHAKGIEVPKLGDHAMVLGGMRHYREMCVGCHGAPGVEPSELAKGLNPSAPNLHKSLRDWSPASMFWIVKHGVMMTGMPGFGPTHDDAKIWKIVAFLTKLPKLSPADYAKLSKEAGPADDSD